MRAYEKEMTAPNGAVLGFHAITRAEMGPDMDAVTLYVSSWPTKQAYLDGHDAVAHAAPRIVLSDLATCSSFVDEIETMLLSEGPLRDASVSEGLATLEMVKRRKWAEIKQERERRVRAAGQTGIGRLDTSPESRSNLTSVTLGLMMNPEQTTIRYTGADNVRREFARADFIAAVMTVLAAVNLIYDQASTLRGSIEAAEDEATVRAVVWP